LLMPKESFLSIFLLVDLVPDAEGPGQMLRQIQQTLSAIESR